MITTRTLPGNRIELTVEGRIEKTDIETAIATIEALGEEATGITVLVDLTGFDGMSFDAFLTDLRYGLGHLSSLGRYQRIAVITDADWIEALVRIENFILRGIDMRGFETDERDEAAAFLDGLSDTDDAPAKPAITRIPADRDDLLAFRIDGHVTDGDAKAMFALLTSAYAAHDRIDLLVEIDDYEGFDASLWMQSEVWSGKMQALSRVRRYAIVGGPAAMRHTARFVGALLPMEIKSFDDDDAAAAWTWIGASRTA